MRASVSVHVSWTESINAQKSDPIDECIGLVATVAISSTCAALNTSYFRKVFPCA